MDEQPSTPLAALGLPRSASAAQQQQQYYQRDFLTEGEEPTSSWVTVYGVRPEDRDLVLRVLRSCGEVLQHGTFGSELGNYLHVQLSSIMEAKKVRWRVAAVNRHLVLP